MSPHEVNPGNEVNSGLEPALGFGNPLDQGRDVFGQPLHRTPTALGNSDRLQLKPEDSDGSGTSNPVDPLTGLPRQNNQPSPIYGDEFESGIPPIDRAAHLAGQALDAVDRVVESSTPIVRQAIGDAVHQIAETVHDSVETAQKQWNAPDNQLRVRVNNRLHQAIDFVKQKVSDLSADPEVQDVMESARRMGRTVADKTGNFIATAQSATENWVDKAFESTYLDNSLRTKPTSIDSTNPPFIGVIDTGFKVQGHGTEVVDAIRRSGQQFPDWLDDSVGTGQWAESLVQFVDAAKSSGRSGAIANLSFDLTQINPDGSVTTRFELTPDEQAALAYARDHNVLLVVSAGNQGESMSALGRASQEFDNILTVGAAAGADRANYSSYGEGLSLLAPDRIQGGERAGTSLAAAQVTGIAAQIWSTNPELSANQVIQALESTATDLNTPGWDAETGFGVLNRSAAIDWAEQAIPEPQGGSAPQGLPNGNQGDRTGRSDELLGDELTWSSLDGAAPSERPNRLLEGSGTGTKPIKQEPSPYQSMSANAAEKWMEAKQNHKPQPSKYQSMSANAAERWNQTKPDASPSSNPKLMKYEQGASLSYDPAVAQWQQRMKDRGYDIAVDGLYGQKSEQVARKFQAEQGLAADGVVGEDTWNAAFKSNAIQPVSIAAIEHSTETATPPTPTPAEPSPKKVAALEHRDKIAAENRRSFQALAATHTNPPDNGNWWNNFVESAGNVFGEVREFAGDTADSVAETIRENGNDIAAVALSSAYGPSTALSTAVTRFGDDFVDAGRNVTDGLSNWNESTFGEGLYKDPVTHFVIGTPIGFSNGFLDATEGIVNLANNPAARPFTDPVGYQVDLATNPTETIKETQQAQEDLGEAIVTGAAALGSNPAIQSSLFPPLRTYNQLTRPEETAQAYRDLGNAFAQPYVDLWSSGRQGEAFGRALFDFGLDIVTLGRGSAATRGSSLVGRVPSVGVADEVIDVARGSDEIASTLRPDSSSTIAPSRSLDSTTRSSTSIPKLDAAAIAPSPRTPDITTSPPSRTNPSDQPAIEASPNSEPVNSSTSTSRPGDEAIEVSPTPTRKAPFQIRGIDVTLGSYVTDHAVTNGRYFTYTFRNTNGDVIYVGRAATSRDLRGAETIFNGRMGNRGKHDILDKHFDEIAEIRIEAVQGSREANIAAEDVLYSQHQVRNPDPVVHGPGREIELHPGAREDGSQLLNRQNPQSVRRPHQQERTRGNITIFSEDQRSGEL